MSQNVTTNIMSIRHLNADDPRITLASGRRTDTLDLESLRAEMIEMGVPGVTMTEGRMDLNQKLIRFRDEHTFVDWKKEK